MRCVVTALLLLSLVGVVRAQEETGENGVEFKELFNGRDLAGWEGDERIWRVEDGLLTGQTTPETNLKANTFAVWTGGEVVDFELTVVFRLEGENNSGVQYRSQRNPKNGKYSLVGYQADIHPAANYTGMLYDEGGRGIAAERGQRVMLGIDGDKRPQPLERVELTPVNLGEWTTLEVIARGNHLVHKINGETTVDVTDSDPENRELKGLLGLQVHAGPPMKVQFKSVKLKQLKGDEPAAEPASVEGESEQTTSIDSPDGRVQAKVSVDRDRLTYRVALDGKELVAPSPLGLNSSAGDFSQGVRIVEVTQPEEMQRSYELPLGKARHVDYTARGSTVMIENAAGGRLEVRFRVANDGVAFAYRFPASAGDGIVVQSEATSFAFAAGVTSFLHPMAVAKSGWMRTQPSYEEYYLLDRPVGEPSPMGEGWCLPALFKIADCGWVLVGETGVEANYFGARLAHESDGGVYRIALPQPEEGAPGDAVEPTVDGGTWLPWRFLIVGDSLAPLVASTMATDLVEPLYETTSAPAPGRAAWSWLALKDERTVPQVQRQFIDMAAELGFQYVLIDSMWDRQIGRDGIAELVQYAADKGVGVLLWYNSNGHWNDAPLTPRDLMYPADVREAEMAWLEKIGVRGVKIDFFGGDKQSMMQLYDGMLRDAARHGLCVNFHGATIPRGWDRMYPNFVTCEAVRGMEFATFEQANADREASHATVLPFTRNVIGPMDFTPLMVGTRLASDDNAPSRRTTLAFELALPVLFHSPVQHFGLVPEDLQRLPTFVLEYLRQLPTTWDETRLVDGYPGNYVVLARRQGERWYVAAINGQDEAVSVGIPGELAERWTAICDDGENQVVERSFSDDGGAVEVELAPRGGAVLISE